MAYTPDLEIERIIESSFQSISENLQPILTGRLGRETDSAVDASSETGEVSTAFVRIEAQPDTGIAYYDPMTMNLYALGYDAPIFLQRRKGKLTIIGASVGGDASTYFAGGLPTAYQYFAADSGANFALAPGGVLTVTGGTNIATTSNGANTITIDIDGTIAVANGGTGRATLTANNLILGNGTSAVTFLAPGASGNVPTSNGTTWVSSPPSVGMTSFTLSGTSGTPQTITNGNTLTVAAGTGITTTAAATDTVTVAIDSTVVTLTGTQYLENKTLKSGTSVGNASGAVDFYLKPSATGTAQIDVGNSRGGNGDSALILTSSASVFPDGTTALRRYAGDNGASELVHSGTGELVIGTLGAGDVRLYTDATTRITIGSAGGVTIDNGKTTLDASTTSGASLNIPAGTAPTSPADGDVWNDSAQNTINSRVDGLTLGGSYPLMTQITNASASNTTTETTMLNADVGTLTIPADYLKVGKMLRLRLMGSITTHSSNTVLTFRWKIGNATIASQARTMTISQSGTTFSIEALLSIDSTGATGTASLRTSYVSPVEVLTIGSANGATIDTTGAYPVDVTVQWTTANPSNVFTCTLAMVEILN